MDSGFTDTNDWLSSLPPMFSPLRVCVNTFHPESFYPIFHYPSSTGRHVNVDNLSNLCEVDVSLDSTENPSQCRAQHYNPIELLPCNDSQEDNNNSQPSLMSMASNSLRNFYEVDGILVESTENPSQCETQNPTEDNNYALSMESDNGSMGNSSAREGEKGGGKNISTTEGNIPRNQNSVRKTRAGSKNNAEGPCAKKYPSVKKSSKYRGVTRDARAYKAMLWNKPDKNGKGKSVYIGGFEYEKEAARARDLAALKCWGFSTPTNFPLKDYENEIQIMLKMTKEEFLKLLRRKSRGFSKGASIYRGVSKVVKLEYEYTRYRARLGRGRGMEGIYLGLFDIEEVAALAYDIAAIKTKGKKAITNFHLRSYNIEDIEEKVDLPLAPGVWKYLDIVYGIKINTQANPQIQFSRPIESIMALLHQNPNISLHENQNPNFQQPGLTSLHGITGTGSGLNFNRNSSGSSKGGFPSGETMTQTDDNSIDGFWEGIEQLLPFKNTDKVQPSSKNQHIQFGLNENDVNRVLNENTSSSIFPDLHNPNLQTHPSLLQGLTGTEIGLETIGNSTNSSTEIFSTDNGMQGENSIFMETNNTMEGNQVQPISTEIEGWFENILEPDLEDEFSFMNSNWVEGNEVQPISTEIEGWFENILEPDLEDEFSFMNSNWVDN